MTQITALDSPRAPGRASPTETAVADEPDESEARCTSPQPGFAAGMAFCIPSLTLLGLLYSLLK